MNNSDEQNFPDLYRALLSDLFPESFQTGMSSYEFERQAAGIDGKRLALAFWDLNDAPGPRNKEILLAWYGIGAEYEGVSEKKCHEAASQLLGRPLDATRSYVEMLVGSVRAYYQIADKKAIKQTRRFVERTYGHRL